MPKKTKLNLNELTITSFKTATNLVKGGIAPTFHFECLVTLEGPACISDKPGCRE